MHGAAFTTKSYSPAINDVVKQSYSCSLLTNPFLRTGFLSKGCFDWWERPQWAGSPSPGEKPWQRTALLLADNCSTTRQLLGLTMFDILKMAVDVRTSKWYTRSSGRTLQYVVLQSTRLRVTSALCLCCVTWTRQWSRRLGNGCMPLIFCWTLASTAPTASIQCLWCLWSACST